MEFGQAQALCFLRSVSLIGLPRVALFDPQVAREDGNLGSFRGNLLDTGYWRVEGIDGRNGHINRFEMPL